MSRLFLSTLVVMLVLLGGVDLYKAQSQDSVVLTDPNTGQRAVVDDISGAQATISFAHHEIHEEDAYTANFVIPGVTGSITEYLGIGFTTPPAAVKRIHMIGEFQSGAAAHVEVIEIPTVLTGGVTLAAYNHARFSTNVTKLKGLTSYDSTGAGVITGGTAISSLYVWTGNKAGGGARGVAEFILKPETVYAIKLTFDANNNGGHILLNWYEHKDADL
jgi:hypothetical protein